MSECERYARVSTGSCQNHLRKCVRRRVRLEAGTARRCAEHENHSGTQSYVLVIRQRRLEPKQWGSVEYFHSRLDGGRGPPLNGRGGVKLESQFLSQRFVS